MKTRREDAATSDADSAPITVSGWLWLCLLAGTATASALCVFCVDGLVDPIKHSFGATDVQMSFVLGWAYVGPLVLCSLPAGWLADRLPRPLILAAGVGFLAAGAATSALAQSYAALCLGRALVGMGVAALPPVAISILADAFPARLRGRVFGVFMATLALGPGMGLTVGGALLALAEQLRAPEPWRLAMGLAAIPSVVAAAILILVREPARPSPSSDEAPAATVEQRSWSLIPLILLAVLAVALCDGAQLSWAATVLARQHYLAPAEAARLAGYVFISGAAAPLIAGVVGDALHRSYGSAGRVIVAIGSTAALLALQGFYSVGTTSLFLAVLVTVGLTVVMGEVIGAALLQDIVPHNRRGLAASAHSLCTLGAIAMGTSLVALAARSTAGSPQALTQAMSTVTMPASSVAALTFVCLGLVLFRDRKSSHPKLAAAPAASHRALRAIDEALREPSPAERLAKEV